MEIRQDSGSTTNPDTIITITQDELKKLQNGETLYHHYEGKNISLRAISPSSTANSSW